MAGIVIDAEKLMSNATMRVSLKNVRRLKIRTWIAIRLIRLAVFVLGCDLRIDD